MKKILLLGMVLFGLTFYSFAEIRRLCKVSYKTEDGWSEEYKLEVQFVTGLELNNKTSSFKYKTLKNYCLVWFGEGKVAILEISNSIFGIGDEFDHEDFVSTFSFRSIISCDQINSENDREWQIKAKEFGRFIDPREEE